MNISVKKLYEMRSKGEKHVLLDVREDEETSLAVIEGALCIPMNSLPDHLDELARDCPLVVMCHVGGRSAQVVSWLLSIGLDNAVNLEGGIAAWSAEIDPFIPTY